MKVAPAQWRSIPRWASLALCLTVAPELTRCASAQTPGDSAAPAQNVDAAAKTLMAADGLLQRNLFKLAADEYGQFLQDNPHHPQATSARWGLALCRYKLGEFDQALPLLSQVVASDQFPQQDQALAMLGYCELVGKKYDDAVTHFRELIDTYPQSPQADAATLYRAQALCLSGQSKQAINACKAYLQSHPQSPDSATALYYLAVSQQALNQNEPALASLQRLARDYPDSPYRFDGILLSGQTLEAQGKLESAVERYRELLAIAPSARQNEAHYTLGIALYKSGKLPEAATELSAAGADASNATIARAAKLQLGFVDLAMGKVVDARTILSALIQDDPPHSADARYGVAQCDIAEKKYDSAESILDNLGKQQPPPANLSQILFYRAVCLMELTKFEQAAKDFDALAAQSTDPSQTAQALYRSAYCLHQLGRYEPSHDRCQRLAKLPVSEMTQPAAELDAENLFLLGKYADAEPAFDALVAGTQDQQQQLLFTLRAGQCDYYTAKFERAITRLTPLADDPRVAQSPALMQSLFFLGDAELQRGDHAQAEATLKKFIAAATGDSREAQYKLAVAELRGNETDAAAAALEALAAGPLDSPWAQRGLLELGQLRYKSGRGDEAGDPLNKLLAVHPAPELVASATYLLAWIDFDAKRYAQAAERWKFVKEQHADQSMAVDAAFEEGVALQQAGKSSAAVTALQSFAAANPTSPNAPQALQLAASILTGEGKDTDAAAILTALSQSPAASDSALYDLAWSQRKLSQNEKAQETYRRIITQYPDGKFEPLARTELAELLYAEGNFSQAGAMLWPVVSAGKADRKVLAAASYRLAWCYQKQNDFDKSAKAFQEFAANYPTDELAPSALLQAALADSDAGRDDAAQQELTSMLKQFPQHKDASVACLKLAEVQAAQNDFAGSLQSSRDFLSKYPSDAMSYRAQFNVGWALENQQQYSDARAAYQKVTAASNGETAARAQFQIGETWLAEKKYDQAAAALLAVEDVYAYPKWSARALFEAGRVFEQLNQPEQAKLQYTQVLTKYKNAPEAELAQGRLKSINGS